MTKPELYTKAAISVPRGAKIRFIFPEDGSAPSDYRGPFMGWNRKIPQTKIAFKRLCAGQSKP